MSRSDLASVESTGTTTVESSIEADTQSVVDWSGPFVERDASGAATGYTYVRCPDCEIEVLTNSRTHATHREGCTHQ